MVLVRMTLTMLFIAGACSSNASPSALCESRFRFFSCQFHHFYRVLAFSCIFICFFFIFALFFSFLFCSPLPLFSSPSSLFSLSYCSPPLGENERTQHCGEAHSKKEKKERKKVGKRKGKKPSGEGVQRRDSSGNGATVSKGEIRAIGKKKNTTSDRKSSEGDLNVSLSASEETAKRCGKAQWRWRPTGILGTRDRQRRGGRSVATEGETRRSRLSSFPPPLEGRQRGPGRTPQRLSLVVSATSFARVRALGRGGIGHQSRR